MRADTLVHVEYIPANQAIKSKVHNDSPDGFLKPEHELRREINC